MTDSVQQRALDLLEAALSLPASQQAGFLADASRVDPALAAELHRLEPARQRTGRFLTLATGGVLPAELPPPARIGPFRLGRLLGRGGMGSVYEARRDDGLFEQNVAIKLLSIRHRSGELEASLAHERRILARLEHRNIARLLDGGQTQDGRSFIVMERVDGEPITAYAARHGLGVEGRVRLFAQLTAALQYAHQQLVVHADLKPSNVLVARDGSVKLLDFGIAALLDRDAPADATGGDSRPVTRAYAPPERSAGGAPTVAGDVYGAGVVLRELVAANPGPLSADLESVLRTATAADPAARYPSIADLRADLERWLAHRAVRVHAGGWRYRAARFVRRNALGVSLMGIIVLGLGVAAAVGTVLLLRAERASQLANRRLEQLIELNALMVDDLSVQFANRPGMADVNQRTLSEALRRVEQLAADRPDDLRLQLTAARNLVQTALHAGTGVRGGPVDGAALHDMLQATARRLATLQVTRGSPAAGELLAVRASIQALLARDAYRFAGDTTAAAAAATAASGLLRETLRATPGSRDTRTARQLVTLIEAGGLSARGRPREALATLDALLRDSPAPDSPQRSDFRDDYLLTEAQFLRCDIQRWTQADATALRTCLDLMAHLEHAIAARGRLVYYERRLAYTSFLVASQLLSGGESRRALEMLDAARDTLARILHFGANDELAGEALVVESARVLALSTLGRIPEARRAASDLLAARRARLAAAPSDLQRDREVAIALRRLGEVEQVAGARAQACAAFAEAAAIWDRQAREGRLLPFDQAPVSGQVPWIRAQLQRCP
jgi:serine/threonine-protein kinase